MTASCPFPKALKGPQTITFQSWYDPLLEAVSALCQTCILTLSMSHIFFHRSALCLRIHTHKPLFVDSKGSSPGMLCIQVQFSDCRSNSVTCRFLPDICVPSVFFLNFLGLAVLHSLGVTLNSPPLVHNFPCSLMIYFKLLQTSVFFLKTLRGSLDLGLMAHHISVAKKTNKKFKIRCLLLPQAALIISKPNKYM